MHDQGLRRPSALAHDDERDGVARLRRTRFVRDDQGQDLIEYALLGSFVSLAAYTGANLLGTSLDSWYTAVSGEVDAAAADVGAQIP